MVGRQGSQDASFSSLYMQSPNCFHSSIFSQFFSNSCPFKHSKTSTIKNWFLLFFFRFWKTGLFVFTDREAPSKIICCFKRVSYPNSPCMPEKNFLCARRQKPRWHFCFHPEFSKYFCQFSSCRQINTACSSEDSANDSMFRKQDKHRFT